MSWEFHAFRSVFDLDSENILDPTFYRNLEPGTKMINTRIDIESWSGSSDVVNIWYNNKILDRTNEDTGIERQRNKTYFSKAFRYILEPG